MMRFNRNGSSSKVLTISAFLAALFLISCDPSKKNQTASSSAISDIGIFETNDFSNYLDVVRRYAAAMIASGRDVYGSEHSPLFASALNREALSIGSKEDYGSIEGVRKNDRSIGGANPLIDIELYKILYSLSEITGNGQYAEEANQSLKYFFKHCQSPETGLMAWGEHLYWDFEDEACGYGKPNEDYHECGVWPFWNISYQLAPEASWKFAIGEWDHQIADKQTGHFSRHARWSEHEPYTGFEFPRYAGQMIERWVIAYNRQENIDRPRREELLKAIKVVYARMEENVKLTMSGYLPAGSTNKGDHDKVVWLTSNLELARCLELAAPLFENKLGEMIRQFALKQDIDFLNAPHKFDSGDEGYAVTLHADTGLPRTRSMNKPYTSSWGSGYGYGPHSKVANLCFERHLALKTKHPNLSERYRNLALVAADQYLSSTPDTSKLLKPDVFASVIRLMLNSYKLTGDRKYLDRANFFGQLGIDLFLDEDSPLPKVTNKHNHYETITGGPEFMNELLNLYMEMHDS
jgi:hypothetical protein